MSAARRPDEPIRTSRLILRKARMLDLPALFEIYRNEEVMQYWADAHVNMDETRRSLVRMEGSPHNGVFAFVIVLPPPSSPASPATTKTTTTTTTTKPPPSADHHDPVDKGKVIGHVGVWYEGSNNFVCMLDSAHWRKGYMTEAISALTPLFWEKGWKAVYADVDAPNEASLALLRKCGFYKVGENLLELFLGGRAEANLRMKLNNPSMPDSGGDGLYDDDDDDDDDKSGRSSGEKGETAEKRRDQGEER